MTMMQESGVPAGVVQTCEDLLSDPQMKHRKHHRVLKHPVIGEHSYHAPAYILSETPCDLNRAGPTLGQDNDYVYKEILGLTDDDIADMLAGGRHHHRVRRAVQVDLVSRRARPPAAAGVAAPCAVRAGLRLESPETLEVQRGEVVLHRLRPSDLDHLAVSRGAAARRDRSLPL